MKKFFVSLLLILGGFVALVVIAVLVAWWAFPEPKCHNLSYESATDAKAFDGQPRQICLNVTKRLQIIKQPPEPTRPVAETELVVARTNAKKAPKNEGGIVRVCEHGNKSCARFADVIPEMFVDSECLDIADGLSCRTVTKEGWILSAIFRHPVSAEFSDINLFFYAFSTDADYIDDISKIVEKATFKK